MDYKALFLTELQNAGIPTTQTEVEAVWDTHIKNSDFAVNNQSPFSPFFKLQKALVSDPAVKLIDALAEHVMPNSFVMLATDEWLIKHGESRKVDKLPAVKAVGNIKISRTDTSIEQILAKGTVIESLPLNGVVYRVITTLDVVFSVGSNEQLAIVEAQQTGINYNLAAGYYVRLITDIEGLTAINENTWLITAGQDIESDENYRLRIRDAFATLGNYHVDAVYRSMISTFPGISADNIAFDKTAPRGPGSANVYVYLDVGEVSQAVLDEINNHIAAGNHGHSDDLLVFAMPTQNVDITATLIQHANTPDKKAEIEQFIKAAFRQNNAYQPTRCKPNDLFSFSQLKTELHNQFKEIKSIHFTNSDITSAVWLPVINNLVISRG
ncbi:hypothetical protein CJF42_22185 [Pseudoalteromonas sp. NBT06-2]|uniref:baseplate J/gp47 family protein n=1 Tax=Pseudoalteromonas sp. NBT06-2 TaxID=2025950 RepID=UPI000BA65316|nr:baseplate J/gp47 family protein [Pseudoalteromonas sp. NBT06-2]PAJ72265.1 hypothetical protein CJF42_22185 [Pseudoalteromonas sp. NBT06-2]